MNNPLGWKTKRQKLRLARQRVLDEALRQSTRESWRTLSSQNIEEMWKNMQAEQAEQSE